MLCINYSLDIILQAIVYKFHSKENVIMACRALFIVKWYFWFVFCCWFKRKKTFELKFQSIQEVFFILFFWNLLILRAFRVCECVSLVLILARRVHDTRKSLTRRQKKKKKTKNSNILFQLGAPFHFFFLSFRQKKRNPLKISLSLPLMSTKKA